MKNNCFSQNITVFHGRSAPEAGYLAGYAALLSAFDLQLPLPDVLSIISHKHKHYTTPQWRIFTPRYQPEDTLMGHLTFALKYEGIDLGLLKKLFERVPRHELTELIAMERTGQYSRKIWFLYEWLMDRQLNLPDLTTGNYVEVVDTSIQYGVVRTMENSKRHRVRNNLPGTKDFCPMIRRTAVLDEFIHADLPERIQTIMGRIHPDIMARTAAFLLLKDSKASYAIEGEKPPQNRAQRWGRAIGQAGQKPISTDELIRLQQVVIDNPRFTKMGYREQEGFVGEHDRLYGTPIPDHISAKWKDVQQLVNGLILTGDKLEQEAEFDAVLAAAMIAFGFVFIHPFVDGNGRIHRYLMHHVLLRKEYVPKGMIFPVSSIILERLDEYRRTLEAFSIPRLDFVEWRPDGKNNVQILNETIDLYRYFDATKQAEFLYSCVMQTIEQTIPEEVEYLEKYDQMKDYLDNVFEMPDKMVALAVRFLEQGNGKFSERAKNKEFQELSADEATQIEHKYQDIFGIKSS
ncbi:Fic family protein [Sphingobacterium chuzhouense]|uniref:Fic family protein n=1 Tax=Sphingobacterium chuzhouense TaxID=1742264 RepID=A0ABR7XTQ4_9SPHI|nr:Fic family protein [Sphingobacterium chuzhouense]MBD1422555.1 Fic family protein [Sphingobacterium chuzhouense]